MLSFRHELPNVLPGDSKLFELLVIDLTWDFVGDTDVLCYFGGPFDMDGDDLDILVLKVGLFEVVLRFVDLFWRECADVLLDVVEEVWEVGLLHKV